MHAALQYTDTEDKLGFFMTTYSVGFSALLHQALTGTILVPTPAGVPSESSRAENVTSKGRSKKQ